MSAPVLEECICPALCDCQNPEPISGAAGVSNACPEHNWTPLPVEGCEAEVHVGGQEWRRLPRW